MRLKTLRDFNLRDKKVLLRLDLNSPIVEGKVLDSPRMKESAKTVAFLLKNRARVVIIAHQGQKGKSDFFPLNQHAEILSEHLGEKVEYINDLFGSKALKAVSSLKSGEAVLLRNVRDYPDELGVAAKNNRYPAFCSLFDIYVNDAFSVCHRNHGSLVIPPKHLPSAMGIGLQRELEALENFSFKSRSKNLFFIGGAKVEDYFPIFRVLKKKKNKIIASGVLANLILVSQGVNLGYENTWLRKKGYLKLVPKLRRIYSKYRKQIILPVDFAVDRNSRRAELSLEDLPSKDKIWDVGHKSVELFASELKGAKSVFMKGPLGYSEIKKFSYSTVRILKSLSSKSRMGGFSLLGGGHLTATIDEYHIPHTFSYISLSGGALIAYLSGEKLPGLEALRKSKN